MDIKITFISKHCEFYDSSNETVDEAIMVLYERFFAVGVAMIKADCKHILPTIELEL